MGYKQTVEPIASPTRRHENPSLQVPLQGTEVLPEVAAHLDPKKWVSVTNCKMEYLSIIYAM